MRFAVSSLLALASVAAAVGNAVVQNNSTIPIYAWSVASSVGPRQTIKPGEEYSEAFHHDEKTGGIAIKITKGPDDLSNGAPEQVFAYSLDGDKVWYDLSSVFGTPFAGQRVEVTSSSGGTIVWENGTNPGGSQVKVAPSSENVIFTLF